MTEIFSEFLNYHAPLKQKSTKMTNDCISTEKDGDIVRDGKLLVELFNKTTLILWKYNLETSHYP